MGPKSLFGHAQIDLQINLKTTMPAPSGQALGAGRVSPPRVAPSRGHRPLRNPSNAHARQRTCRP